MAKKKLNVKEFLLAKGEKIVLIAALAGFGILAVMGIKSFASAESPAKTTNKFVEATKRLNNGVDSTEGDGGVKQPDIIDPKFRPIDPKYFHTSALPFEPVDTPSMKKDNPAVLGITGATLDLVRAPVKAYEVIVGDPSKGEPTRIGLLYNVKVDKNNQEAMARILEGSRPRRRPMAPAPDPMAPAAVPNPMQPNAGPPPAGGGGGGGARGRGRGGNAGGGAATPEGERSEKTLRYVNIEDLDTELKKEGVLPAISVYPLRMIVVQAAFPLKEQLEVIRRALRLRELKEAEEATRPMAPATGQGPTFAGFEVERRIVDATGQEFPWAKYEHVSEYLNKIAIRKVADQADDGLLSLFLRYDQQMAMPLPALAANLGIYPPVRLEEIQRGYRKLQEANRAPVSASDLAKKFQNAAGGNPFTPTNVGGTGGLGGTDAPAITVAPTAPRGKGPGRSPESPRQPVGVAAPQELPQNMVELEHMLIRFIDVDIRPGFTYQYRLRVLMKNPNFKKDREVARPDDAKREILEGPFVEIPASVTVPFDHNLYAGDPFTFSDKINKELQIRDPIVRNLFDNRNGEVPVVQFQTWLERVAIESGKTEPAGYWVVAEVPVHRGEKIGRKQIVPLPMWSSEKITFILQELPKYSIAKSKERPKGLLVDFTTDTLLVDYEGGKVRQKFGERNVEDECDVEMLLLEPDGRVVVHNSGKDKANAERKTREDAWTKWLAEIRRVTDKAGELSNPGAPSQFGPTTPPPAGGGGGGGGN